jgi:hypothetical protein
MKTLLLATTVLTLSLVGAQAQSLPPEGPVSVTFTATAIPAPKPMPISGGKQFMLVDYAMTATNDAGNPILNNMGGRCQMSRLVDPGAKTVEVHGWCTYADGQGDQIFEQCDWLPGSPNNCKLAGGTGKFQGLEGSVVISASPVKGNFDGVLQVIGEKKGSYKILKTN